MLRVGLRGSARGPPQAVNRGVAQTRDRFQISRAYCATVRSLENVPMRATLSIALRTHNCGLDVLRGKSRSESRYRNRNRQAGNSRRVSSSDVANPSEQARLAGTEAVRGQFIEHPPQARIASRNTPAADTRARRSAPRSARAVSPKMKMLSAPTSSRISMLAPSSVPIVSAPFMANFMLPVPDASRAGGRDLLGHIGGGNDLLRQRDAVVGKEATLINPRVRGSLLITAREAVDQLDDHSWRPSNRARPCRR